MTTALNEILTGRLAKEDMVLFINNDPQQFANAVKLALSNDENLGWRAAWMVQSIMERDDQRVKKHTGKIIRAVENKKDGHQRELLRILMKMKINENNEGYLLDQCILIWGSINKSSSVRIIAFQIIARILKKYPELSGEIEPLTEKQYYENLSAGIKGSFLRIKEKLFQ